MAHRRAVLTGNVTSLIDQVVTEVLTTHGSRVWTLEEPTAALDEDMSFDVTLRSANLSVAPDVRIVQSDTFKFIQLAIGRNMLDLWWKDPNDALQRVEELRAVLQAISMGRYRAKVTQVAHGRIVYGEIDLGVDVLRMETVIPS